MSSSVHAPEVAPVQGIEVPFDGIEPERDDPHHLPDSSSTIEKEAELRRRLDLVVSPTWLSRHRRIGLICVITAVIVAAVVGPVVGIKRSQHTSASLRPSATPTSPSSFTPNSPHANITVDLSQRILLNTSIASAICPTGDHWVFLQDQQNVIRAALRTPKSTWSFFSNETIPSNARPGSPLSASCVTLSSSLVEECMLVNITTGILVSIIFFDEFDYPGQSFFSGGSWHSVDTGPVTRKIVPWLGAAYNETLPPPPVPASANSRLSISTNIVPATVDNSFDYGYFPQNNSLLAPFDLLSSVAIYQTNDRAYMADLVGTSYRGSSISNIDNLFAQFQFIEYGWPSLNESSVCGVTNMLTTSSPGGFACSYNTIIDSTYYSPFLSCPQISRGNTTLVCVSPDVFAAARYEPYLLGQSNSQIVGIYSGVSDYQSSYLFPGSTEYENLGTPSNTTDLNLVPLSKSQLAITYLSASGNIRITSLFSQLSSIWSDPIPYGHISSSADGNSSAVYTYYQVNATTMAEVTFDSDNGSWKPTHFHIDTVTD